MSAFFHSIRWRVQVWHGLILLVVIVAFCLTAYRLAWNNQFRRIDRNLVQTERSLIHVLMDSSQTGQAADPTEKRQPFSPARLIERLRAGQLSLPAATAAAFSGNQSGYAYFSLRDADGRLLLESPNVPGDLEFLPVPVKEFSDELRTRNHRREMLRSSPEGLRAVVGLDLGPEREEMRHFAWSLAAVGFGVWLLGLLGGWWLSGRAIQPIAAISRTATRIAEGNLKERISTAGTESELDQLSRVLNRTFERLHSAFERQKQFTADASHELRTPITILLTETQRILKRDRTPEDYRATLQTCQDAADRMRRLVEALLLLARQEADTISVHREPCDLATVLRETIAHFQPLATTRGIHLNADLQPAPCQADSTSLSILAANLVSNAIEHNRPSVNVTVSSGRTAEGATFAVRDDGPGIPEEDLPHIFERFYRADKARSSAPGHSGLGLAIAKTITDNHRGSIEVKSTPGVGTCFTVKLPRHPSLL